MTFVLVVFRRRRLSVGSTNCFTRPFVFLRGMFKVMYKSVFLPAFIGRFDKLFYPAFCVFYEECLRLCISRFLFFAGVYHSVRQTVLPGLLCY